MILYILLSCTVMVLMIIRYMYLFFSLSIQYYDRYKSDTAHSDCNILVFETIYFKSVDFTKHMARREDKERVCCMKCGRGSETPLLGDGRGLTS